MNRTEDKRRASTSAPAKLRNNLEKDLRAYAMTACAAGVSVLACAPPAAAKIVYTPANRFIFGTLKLDLDHGRKADFLVSNTFTTYNHNGGGSLKVKPQDSRNMIWGTGTRSTGGYASALLKGVVVGPSKHFQAGHAVMARFNRFCTSVCSFRSAGPWVDTTRRYLGLKFLIDGKVHYGWARLNVTVNMKGVGAVLTGYAYETVPDKPIVTGQTKGSPANGGDAQESSASFDRSVRPAASLGLLARGAGGLDIWRRPRTMAKLTNPGEGRMAS